MDSTDLFTSMYQYHVVNMVVLADKNDSAVFLCVCLYVRTSVRPYICLFVCRNELIMWLFSRKKMHCYLEQSAYCVLTIDI